MLIITQAKREDGDTVVALDSLHTGTTGRESFLRKSVEAHECLIARLNNLPVGFAIGGNSFFGQAFIELLLVHPAYRRQGIAENLMKRVEAECNNPKLFTSTNQSNLPMQALCEKLGYIKSGYIENLDEGDPEIIYFKRLNPEIIS